MESALQVVASIHQPNSQITECFDDLLLLAGGRTAYFGPWQSSMPYFASVGFACPVYTNPSDHYLLTLKEAGSLLTKVWADSAVAKANLAEGYQSSCCSPGQLTCDLYLDLLIRIKAQSRTELPCCSRY